MELTSQAFAQNERMPRRYSGDGEDLSPPLTWSGVPENAVELALICDDPDAPMAEPFVHWVAYGIDPVLGGLPEGVPAGKEVNDPVSIQQGETSFGKAGYGGPAPPRGHGVHHYHFKLYALSQPLNTGGGLSKQELLDAMEGKIIEQTTLTGTYER